MAVLRRRVPTILQQEAAECGVACLAMVLAYQGSWRRLEALRELCGVSRDGTKASNLVKAARQLGLVAKGLKREPEQLAALPAPFIVFWNFNHFIVVEAVSEKLAKGVRVVDPATGPRTLTAAEFDGGFTGVVLAFETGPDFKPAGSRPNVARLMLDRLRGYRPVLAVTVLAGLLILIPGVLGANLTSLFVDQVVASRRASWLLPVLGTMIVLALLRAALTLLQQRVLARAQAAFVMQGSIRLMQTVLHLPLAYFAQRYPGDIANRFTMGDRLGAIVLGGLASAALSLITVAGYGVALVFMDRVLAAIALGFAALALALLALSAGAIEEANRRNVADDGRLRAATIQGLSMVEEFRAAGMETRFTARWSGFQARVIDAEQAAGRLTSLLSSGAGLVLALGSVAVLAAGAIRVLDGSLGLGRLLAFQLLAAGLTAPLMLLVAVGGQVQNVRGLVERLDDMEGAATAPPAVFAEPREARPGLALDDVAFGYTPLDAPLIEGLCLHVPPGSRVALVGGTGSGKSTIGRLMIGLLPPRAGQVSLDGVALPAWDALRLRPQIGYVDQTVGLFEGTVGDNVTLWDRSLPEARLVLAAQDAAVHDTILRRPGGYGAMLNENGRNFSGGERQRLAIARALAQSPRLLVLDEATSALDTLAEQEVMEAVRRRGCACVVIAHRLSAIRDSDEIIVLDRGAIVERGRHEALMARGGLYRMLVEH